MGGFNCPHGAALPAGSPITVRFDERHATIDEGLPGGLHRRWGIGMVPHHTRCLPNDAYWPAAIVAWGGFVPAVGRDIWAPANMPLPATVYGAGQAHCSKYVGPGAHPLLFAAAGGACLAPGSFHLDTSCTGTGKTTAAVHLLRWMFLHDVTLRGVQYPAWHPPLSFEKCMPPFLWLSPELTALRSVHGAGGPYGSASYDNEVIARCGITWFMPEQKRGRCLAWPMNSLHYFPHHSANAILWSQEHAMAMCKTHIMDVCVRSHCICDMFNEKYAKSV
jgi:hypothetical protein